MEIKEIFKEIKGNQKYKKNIKEFAVSNGIYTFILKNGGKLEIPVAEFHDAVSVEPLIEQANKLC